MATTGTDRALEELDVVEFTKRLEKFPRGTRGTIVSAHPEVGVFTVEIADARGRTLGLVPAHAGDLRLVRRRP